MNCMAGFILVLSLFTLPSALPEFTVSPANQVTARPRDAPATPPNTFKERRTEVGETGPLVVPLGASEGTAGDGDGKDDVEDGEMGWRRMGGRDGGGGVTGCVV